MRQIKFRVWDRVYQTFIDKTKYEIIFSSFNSSFGKMILRWNDYLPEEMFYPPNQILNQFTGLFDKNGKEIYEGDYVKFPNFSPSHETSEFKISEVFWYADEAGFFVGSRSKMISPIQISSIIEDIEIIGNIYENPELLNNK